jgi:hypothetical protein
MSAWTFGDRFAEAMPEYEHAAKQSEGKPYPCSAEERRMNTVEEMRQRSPIFCKLLSNADENDKSELVDTIDVV